ncbi:hypothetical protein COO60DRAFT_1472487 [Scenedesmus sp. NREL 46B-D3]|nr:hypothetical protein COO60DRAFT_1472487 [Scenedesmus sp. NREL 46B-D3]
MSSLASLVSACLQLQAPLSWLLQLQLLSQCQGSSRPNPRHKIVMAVQATPTAQLKGSMHAGHVSVGSCPAQSSWRRLQLQAQQMRRRRLFQQLQQAVQCRHLQHMTPPLATLLARCRTAPAPAGAASGLWTGPAAGRAAGVLVTLAVAWRCCAVSGRVCRACLKASAARPVLAAGAAVQVGLQWLKVKTAHRK